MKLIYIAPKNSKESLSALRDDRLDVNETLLRR